METLNTKSGMLLAPRYSDRSFGISYWNSDYSPYMNIRFSTDPDPSATQLPPGKGLSDGTTDASVALYLGSQKETPNLMDPDINFALPIKRYALINGVVVQIRNNLWKEIKEI